mmetsp:Transcript_10238/g.15718  ORF Transcript_10238/g.15718 Transcript_10238/m.15718 type:complete len:124 (+) Transcript_10238:546-917(+)
MLKYVKDNVFCTDITGNSALVPTLSFYDASIGDCSGKKESKNESTTVTTILTTMHDTADADGVLNNTTRNNTLPVVDNNDGDEEDEDEEEDGGGGIVIVINTTKAPGNDINMHLLSFKFRNKL